MVTATSQPLYPHFDLVPIVQEAGWALRLLWTGAESLSPPGFDPQPVQPAASRYIDYAIPATTHFAFTSNSVCVQFSSCGKPNYWPHDQHWLPHQKSAI
jgi:hypothetical protein